LFARTGLAGMIAGMDSWPTIHNVQIEELYFEFPGGFRFMIPLWLVVVIALVVVSAFGAVAIRITVRWFNRRESKRPPDAP